MGAQYLLTAPKIAKLREPVDEYLASFSTNQALLDIIAQHFFQKTPTFFALSYFSLYLDYRYPRGGTGALPKALEQFILGSGGEIRLETEITCVDPAKPGDGCQGQCLSIQEAGLGRGPEDALPGCRPDISDGQQGAQWHRGKKGSPGGEKRRRFRFHLVSDGRPERAHFAQISSPHFFYTPSITGLSQVSLDELRSDDPGPLDSSTTDRVSRSGLGGSWITRPMRYPIPRSGMPHSRRRAKPGSSSARSSIMP